MSRRLNRQVGAPSFAAIDAVDPVRLPLPPPRPMPRLQSLPGRAAMQCLTSADVAKLRAGLENAAAVLDALLSGDRARMPTRAAVADTLARVQAAMAALGDRPAATQATNAGSGST